MLFRPARQIVGGRRDLLGADGDRIRARAHAPYRRFHFDERQIEIGSQLLIGLGHFVLEAIAEILACEPGERGAERGGHTLAFRFDRVLGRLAAQGLAMVALGARRGFDFDLLDRFTLENEQRTRHPFEFVRLLLSIDGRIEPPGGELLHGDAHVGNRARQLFADRERDHQTERDRAENHGALGLQLGHEHRVEIVDIDAGSDHPSPGREFGDV